MQSFFIAGEHLNSCYLSQQSPFYRISLFPMSSAYTIIRFHQVNTDSHYKQIIFTNEDTFECIYSHFLFYCYCYHGVIVTVVKISQSHEKGIHFISGFPQHLAPDWFNYPAFNCSNSKSNLSQVLLLCKTVDEQKDNLFISMLNKPNNETWTMTNT